MEKHNLVLNPKLVIFDMDGTMLDTENLSNQGMILAAKEQGYTLPEDLFERIIGRNQAYTRRLVAKEVGPGFDFDKGTIVHHAYMDNYFREFGPPIKKGLMELLDLLESRGIKKCVATSSARVRAGIN